MAITGEFIKTRRESLNWTQQDLADKMNVTTRTIINWEQGGKIPKHSEQKLHEILEGLRETDSLPLVKLYISKADFLKSGGRILIEVI